MTSITSAQLLDDEWFTGAVRAGDSEKIEKMIYAGYA
jgi:hypothetical protein